MLQDKGTPQKARNHSADPPMQNTNLLLGSITAPAILLNPDGTVKWMNTYARELSGCSEGTFGRLPAFLALDLRTPDTHQDIPYEKDDNGVVKLEPKLANHLLITDLSGNTHHVTCSCIGVLSEISDIPDSLLILSDITENFKQSPNVDAYQFQIEKLVDASDVATWSMDIESGNVTVNDRWFSMLGYEPGELNPVDMKLWRELVHPDDHPKTIRDLDLHFQGAIPRYEDDIRIRHKDGHWIWIHAIGKVNEWFEDGSAKTLLGSHQNITKRKLDEYRLKDNETHLRKLLDNLFVFVAVLSPDGVVQWANKGPLQAAGVGLEDVIGKYFWDAPWFIKGDPATEKLKQACREARNGKRSRFDMEHIRPSGQKSVEDFMISPLFDDNGTVTHLIPTAADISDRHQMMKAAEDSKHLLESVLENIPALVFVKDAKEFRYTHLNRNGEDMLNRKREEMLGKNSYDFFPTEQAEGFEQHDREALTLDHGTGAIDHPVKRGDGTLGYYRTCKVAMRDADGIPTHLVGISLDVTSLIESEEALKNINKDLEIRVAERTKELAHSETRFRLAMHESSIGIALVSLEGKWLDVNKCITEMLGYTREELLKIDFQRVTDPADLAADLEYLRCLVSGESSSHQYDKRFIHKDGLGVWAQINIAMAKDDRGNGQYIVAQIQDITLEKLRSAVTEAITQEFINLEFEEYCKQTVKRLCQLFGVASAFISEVDENSSSSLHTRSLIFDGKHLPNHSYEKTSPSLNDLSPGQRTYFVDQNHEALYARREFIREHSIQGYAEVPMYSSSGRVIGYIGMMDRLDIENNDGLSEALNLFAVAVGTALERERSQKRYYDLVSFAPDGMLMLDLHGQIKFANRAAEQQLQRTGDELTGCELSSMVVPEEKERIRKFLQIESDITTGEIAQTKTFAVRDDGISYPVEMRASSTGDEQGELICVTLSDLSVRYEAEREMRQALAMLDSTEDAAFILDPDNFKFTYVNQAAVDQIGYSKEELINHMGPTDIIPKMTDKKLREDLGTLLSREGRRTDFDTVHLLRDGTTIPVRTTIRFIELPNDQTCYVALSRDITQRLQQEKDRAARIAAEEANAAKSAFLAAMSHEIRTPMNGVIGSVDLLARSSLMAQQVDLVDTISDSANGLLRVVDDILDFSKIDAGKLDLESEPVSLCQEAESACAALAPVALNRNVSLYLYTDPNLPNWISNDSVRIRQILNNLVSNAIKFSSRETGRGLVTVSVEKISESAARIIVDDDGIGMKQEAIDKLFQPFSQAESSTTRRFGGTGLGLSICHKLIKILGGTIEVSSTFGKGTSFCVTLPFRVDNDASPPPENPSLQDIPCIVVTTKNQPGSDIWLKYLAYAGAAVKTCSGLSDVKTLIDVNNAAKTIVVIPNEDEARAEAWRNGFPENARPSITLLQDGQRRLPREISPGLTSVDQPAMTLRNFLVAIAIAAGLGGYEAELEPRLQEAKRRTMNRKDAIDSGQLILVAEDNEVNQKVIRRQLDLLGYAADVKDNGREALYAWKTGEYGLVLTDLHMPEMDGYELSASIRECEQDKKRVPIIALTANALKDEKARCISHGMDDYLTKPIALEKLEDSLMQWLPLTPVSDEDAGASSVNASAPCTLDVSVLAGLIGDDAELIAEFLSEYRRSLDEGTVEIQAAIKESDFNALHEAAHKLKSSSRSVGALEMGEYCATLEHLVGEDAKDLSKLLETFNELQKKLKESLNNATKNASAQPA